MEKRLIICTILCCLFSINSFAKKPLDRFFKSADQFFSEYVHDELVDYSAIQKNSKSLESLVEIISKSKIKEEKEDVQKAFLVNAYNLLVIKAVVDNYPINYPLEFQGLFERVVFKVAEENLSLNQIEDKLGSFKDFRMVFLLSPASIGATSLFNFAILPNKLEKQSEERIRKISNNNDFIRVASNTHTILFNETFYRSRKYFPFSEFIQFINKYREDSLPLDYRIDFYPSNRNLNKIGTIDW